MKISFRIRVLGTVVLACLVGVVVTAVMDRLSFLSGFREYLDTQQNIRMTAIAAFIGIYHEEQDGWGGNPEVQWEEILGFVERRSGQNLVTTDSEPGHPMDALMRPQLILSLLDVDGRRLAGERLEGARDDLITVPVMARGNQVATLVSPRQSLVVAREGPLLEQEQEFIRKMQWRSVQTALIALLLVLPVAIYASRRGLQQISRVMRGIGSLSEGHYDQRIVSSRRDEIGDVLRKINHLAATLEANRNSQRRWISDISHELRTPVSVLAGEIEALVDGVREPTPDQLRSLSSEVERLQRLVEDLYTLSRSDLGDLNYEKQPVNLNDLVAMRLDSFSERIDQAGLELDIDLADENLMVDGDPMRLVQLVGNLLENSCRYTDAGGRIEVKVERDGDQALLSVQDSSPAVPDEALSRLTERLFRIEQSRSRDFGGSGLGLAICQSIVLAHAGSLKFTHSELGGLRAEVRLPLIQG